MLFDFHEITYSLLFRRLDDLKFFTLHKLIAEPAYLRLVLKSTRFLDSLSKKMKSSGILPKIWNLAKKIDTLKLNLSMESL